MNTPCAPGTELGAFHLLPYPRLLAPRLGWLSCPCSTEEKTEAGRWQELGFELRSVCIQGLGSVHQPSLPGSDHGGCSVRRGVRHVHNPLLGPSCVPHTRTQHTHAHVAAVAKCFRASCHCGYPQQLPTEAPLPAHFTDRETEAQGDDGQCPKSYDLLEEEQTLQLTSGGSRGRRIIIIFFFASTSILKIKF